MYLINDHMLKEPFVIYRCQKLDKVLTGGYFFRRTENQYAILPRLVVFDFAHNGSVLARFSRPSEAVSFDIVLLGLELLIVDQ